MALSLTAEQKSIFDLFSGKDQYIIPPYQRPYAWQHRHCRVLFDDLTNAYFHHKDEGYFLGNLVISQNNRDRNSLEVIDGQQRLTTLLLLIKVLLLFDETNDDLKNALNIPSSRRGGESKPRLKTMVFMAEDSDFLQEALTVDLAGEGCKETKDANRFTKNICYFYQVTKEFSRRNNIQDFIDFLMFDIYFLPIVTEGDDPDKARKKALTIFETINDRGLNLATADILKAKLYSLALNELKHDDFIEKWRDFDGGCVEIDYRVDKIFRIYSVIVSAKEGFVNNENDLRVFFLEKDYSPFNKKAYSEIIDDLLRIISSIRIARSIKVNPGKYGDLTKWMQVALVFSNNSAKYNTIIILFFYFNKLSDEKKAIDFLKELTIARKNQNDYFLYRYQRTGDDDMEYREDECFLNKIIISVVNSKVIRYSCDASNYNYSFYGQYITIKEYEKFILLYYYLNNKAIYPYYIYDLNESEKKKGSDFDFSEIVSNPERLVITNFLPKNIEELNKTSIIETKNITEIIMNKSKNEVDNFFLKRKKDMVKSIHYFFLNGLEE